MRLFSDKLHHYRVLANSENASSCFAATELQKFLFQIFAQRIEIDFSVREGEKYVSCGETALAREYELEKELDTYAQDSFALIPKDQHLFIVGQNDRAVIFGAYEFLERWFGVVFVSPDQTELGSGKLLSFPVATEICEPEFEIRNVLTGDIYRGSVDALWALRKRQISEFTNVKRIYGGNIGWYDGVGQVHNALEYAPPQLYGEKYPQFYYRNEKGFRDLCLGEWLTEDGEIDKSKQPNLIDVVIESMKGFVRASKPTDKYFLLAQMDNTDYCQCEKCMRDEEKYGRGGMNIRFANVVARAVNEWAKKELNGREIYVITFAYIYSEMPPVKTNDFGKKIPLHPSVVADDHVIIRLAPIFANNYYPFLHKKQLEKYRVMFTDWEYVAKNFFVWTYAANFPAFFDYYPVLHTYKENFRRFKEMGVKYLMVQSSHTEKQDWQAKMLAYVCTKLMWDIEIDVEEAKTEFLRYYFGASAYPFVQKALEKLDGHFAEIFAKNETVYHFCEFEIYKANYQPYEFLKDIFRILKDAIDAVEKENQTQKELYIKHVKQFMLNPAFMILNNLKDYNLSKEEKRLWVNTFFGLAEELGVERYQESKTLHELKIQYIEV